MQINIICETCVVLQIKVYFRNKYKKKKLKQLKQLTNNNNSKKLYNNTNKNKTLTNNKPFIYLENVHFMCSLTEHNSPYNLRL